MTLPTNLCETDAKRLSLQPVSDVGYRPVSNLKGDRLNFLLLLLLYTMQGFPMGLTSAIPILLQDKNNGSYEDQALFSLVLWPFSLKLLWAPLVDALYVKRLGRRKSWLVPVQYVMGICFCYMAQDIDDLLPETGKPDIKMLIYMFFTANFLAATQDIVIDGWAMTMLKKNNIGHASTCNTAGQTIGVTIGSVFSVLLTSEDFCNRYMRSSPDVRGIVTMKDILYTWGILFILVTTLIAIFKKEKDSSLEDDHVRLNVIQNYSLLWDIMKLPNIQLLAIALLTSRIGFCVTDSVTSLKLIDAGVSKDDIAIIITSMSVVKILIPLMASKYTTGPEPMSIYLKATAMKLIWNIPCILLIYFAPQYIDASKVEDTPQFFYTVLIFILFIDEILYYIMFVSIMAFFLRISDSRFGGTYITFLNTVINLGMAWSSTAALGMIDVLTFEKCSADFRNDCSTTEMRDICEDLGGGCTITVNGFYAGTLLSMFFGFVWYGIFKNTLQHLQNKNVSHWVVNMKRWSSDNIDGSISITLSRQC